MRENDLAVGDTSSVAARSFSSFLSTLGKEERLAESAPPFGGAGGHPIAVRPRLLEAAMRLVPSAVLALTLLSSCASSRPPTESMFSQMADLMLELEHQQETKLRENRKLWEELRAELEAQDLLSEREIKAMDLVLAKFEYAVRNLAKREVNIWSAIFRVGVTEAAFPPREKRPLLRELGSLPKREFDDPEKMFERACRIYDLEDHRGQKTSEHPET